MLLPDIDDPKRPAVLSAIGLYVLAGCFGLMYVAICASIVGPILRSPIGIRVPMYLLAVPTFFLAGPAALLASSAILVARGSRAAAWFALIFCTLLWFAEFSISFTAFYVTYYSDPINRVGPIFVGVVMGLMLVPTTMTLAWLSETEVLMKHFRMFHKPRGFEIDEPMAVLPMEAASERER